MKIAPLTLNFLHILLNSFSNDESFSLFLLFEPLLAGKDARLFGDTEMLLVGYKMYLLGGMLSLLSPA